MVVRLAFFGENLLNHYDLQLLALVMRSEVV